MLDAMFPLSVSYVPVSLLRTMRFSHLKSRCLRNPAVLVRMACMFGFQGCWTWHASSIGIDLRETAMVTASASEEPTDIPNLLASTHSCQNGRVPITYQLGGPFPPGAARQFV